MPLLRFLFFGNYFYGFCAIAMMIETCTIFKLKLPPVLFLLLVFMAVVWFYTKAYILQNQTSLANKRTSWYLQNRKLVLNTQMSFVIAMPVLGVLLLPNIYKSLQLLTLVHWLFISIPLVLALGYYGINNKINLRRFLILKPVSIAIIWSFIASFLPIIYHQLQNNQSILFSNGNLIWSVVNFLFMLALAIMFDIKDFAADANAPIKTFVTKFGLSNTIYKIILPICCLLFIAFLVFFTTFFKISILLFVNIIPYILLLITCLSLQKPKSIFYYLIVIDGLMFVKSIITILTFKFLL
jgi:hypothetical protein